MDERPDNRSPLLLTLAAPEWKGVGSVSYAEPVQPGVHFPLTDGMSGHFTGKDDILTDGQRVNKMRGLEDQSDMASTEGIKLSGRKRSNILVPDNDLAGSGCPNTSQEVQKGGFATSGFPPNEPLFLRSAPEVGKAEKNASGIGEGEITGFDHAGKVNPKCLEGAAGSRAVLLFAFAPSSDDLEVFQIFGFFLFGYGRRAVSCFGRGLISGLDAIVGRE